MVGNFTFRILCFPFGNQAGGGFSSIPSNPKISVYVECTDVATKDPRWVYNSVKFSVCLINFKDVRKSLYHEDSHSFCQSAVDRGWPEVIAHSDIENGGWVNEQGQLCIRAAACSRQADGIILGHDYDTRRETGYIGLKNLGATCYLNGLLQSYFHLGKFREIVYSMGASEGVSSGVSSPSGNTRMSLPLALQSIFLQMETSLVPVNSIELIRAFGWDTMDAFTQHDVQELARILCDKLEEKLKKSGEPASIQKLFQGSMENYIECVDIECKSTRVEGFYDIPLNVRGLTGEPLKTLENALREFISVELLENENAYDADGFGKQRAKKGIRFERFPPVLSFQLKRFSFDFEKLDNVKLHDRFEFSEILDLDQLLQTSISKTHHFGKYLLHTVLVHSGDVNSGHYYAFVRPDGKKWFKFDDEQVTVCSSDFAAVEDNFGGADLIPSNYFATDPLSPKIYRPRIHSAYMLVYVSEASLAEILTPPASVAEVRARVEAETRRIDAHKRMQEEQKQNVEVRVRWMTNNVTGKDKCSESSLGQIKRETKVHQLASLIGLPGKCSDVALFYLNDRKRWSLMPVVGSASGTSLAVTPRNTIGATLTRLISSRSMLADVSHLLNEGGGHDLKFFASTDESCMQILAAKGVGFGNWIDSTEMALVSVAFFDELKRTITHVGEFAVKLSDPIGSLVPLLSANETDLGSWLAFSADNAKLVDGTVCMQSLFSKTSEEASRAPRMVEIESSFAAENLATGAILIFQRNTIADAETQESSSSSSCDEESIRRAQSMILNSPPPLYPILTIVDFVNACNCRVDAKIFLHKKLEPAVIDGIYANGIYNSNGGLLGDIASAFPVALQISVDARWSLRTLHSEIAKKLALPTQKIFIFDSVPGVLNDAGTPLHCSAARIGTCKSLIPIMAGSDQESGQPGWLWELHVLPVDIWGDFLSVRVFDQNVVEMVDKHSLLPVSRDTKSSCLVGELIDQSISDKANDGAKWAVVETADCEIKRVHTDRDEILDFQILFAARRNVFFDFIRIERLDELYCKLNGVCKFWVSHVEKLTGRKFGYPFLLAVPHSNPTVKQIKLAIQSKLNVPEKQLNKWRICVEEGSNIGGINRLIYPKDDDPVNAFCDLNKVGKLIIEHARHPNLKAISNRENNQLSRSITPSQKALTIR